MHSSLISWRDRYLIKTKDLSKNTQNRRSGGKSNLIYETFKNIVIPHGLRIYVKANDMAKAIICANSKLDNALSHWTFVLRFFVQCPSINIPDQETDDKHPNPSPSIIFHSYHLIARCTKHVRILLTNKKNG